MEFFGCAVKKSVLQRATHEKSPRKYGTFAIKWQHYAMLYIKKPNSYFIYTFCLAFVFPLSPSALLFFICCISPYIKIGALCGSAFVSSPLL